MNNIKIGNREIKFRKWDGKYMRFDKDFNIHSIHKNQIHDGKKVEPIMQYTGLKDKNEKEIYEGDIIRRHGFENSYIVTHGAYRRKNFMKGDNQQEHCGFYAKPISNFDEKHDIEWNDPSNNLSLIGKDFGSGIIIVGNILENPELLKK